MSEMNFACGHWHPKLTWKQGDESFHVLREMYCQINQEPELKKKKKDVFDPVGLNHLRASKFLRAGAVG